MERHPGSSGRRARNAFELRVRRRISKGEAVEKNDKVRVGNSSIWSSGLEEDHAKDGLKPISGVVKKGDNEHGYEKGVPKWILNKKEKVPEIFTRVKNAVSAEIARKDKLQYFMKLRNEEMMEFVEYYSKDDVLEIKQSQFLKFEAAALPENVKVFVIESNEQLEDCLNFVCEQSDPKFLGFDCEWLPNGKEKGVDLLQLAFDSYVLLIRVCKSKITKEGLPKKLKEILEDENILKFCQAPSQEVKILNNLWGFDIKGMVDTADLGDFYCCRPFGLLSLVALFLRKRLCKDPIIQCSNWKASSLSVKQINYSAVDAWVSKQVGLAILEKYSKQFNLQSLHESLAKIRSEISALPVINNNNNESSVKRKATSEPEGNENSTKQAKSL
jgi:hypothetical protein